MDSSCGRRSSFSSSRLSHNNDDDDDDDENENNEEDVENDVNTNATQESPTPSTSSKQFQSILKSRRTISNFLPLTSNETNHHHNIHHPIAQAIERAAECAVHAPNHHRTEPLTLKRILAPGPKAEALTNVCYEVALRRGLEKGMDREDAVRVAETKREKWRGTVSAFVVALVSGSCEDGHGDEGESGMEEEDLYEELPFRAPQSERQLEDVSFVCVPLLYCQ